MSPMNDIELVQVCISAEIYELKCQSRDKGNAQSLDSWLASLYARKLGRVYSAYARGVELKTLTETIGFIDFLHWILTGAIASSRNSDAVK